jgi:hypothetical protein
VAVVAASACGGSGNVGGAGTTAAAPATSTVTTTVTTTPTTTGTATPTTTRTPGSGTTGDGAPRCRSVTLRAALGPAEGAAGSVLRPLVLTNTGRQACTLQGFPGVSYVTGDAGRQVGAAAVRSGPAGRRVTLAPGASAQAPVRLVDVRNFAAAACRPTTVRGLRIFPPGETAALFVPAPGTGCAGTPPGPQLSVRAVEAP